MAMLLGTADQYILVMGTERSTVAMLRCMLSAC